MKFELFLSQSKAKIFAFGNLKVNFVLYLAEGDKLWKIQRVFNSFSSLSLTSHHRSESIIARETVFLKL